jgi:hypothetical protein
MNAALITSTATEQHLIIRSIENALVSKQQRYNAIPVPDRRKAFGRSIYREMCNLNETLLSYYTA